jgi:hypothetical protein
MTTRWHRFWRVAPAGKYHRGMATLETGEMLNGLEQYASGKWRGAPRQGPARRPREPLETASSEVVAANREHY